MLNLENNYLPFMYYPKKLVSTVWFVKYFIVFVMNVSIIFLNIKPR